MAAPQAGQAELGKTIDCSRGSRWMTTLRKLPIIAPSTAMNPIAIDSGTPRALSVAGKLISSGIVARLRFRCLLLFQITGIESTDFSRAFGFPGRQPKLVL